MEENYIEKILPVRYIPFDIGIELNDPLWHEMNDALGKIYRKKPISLEEQTLFTNCAGAFNLNDSLKVYLFKEGIGVFSFIDEPYIINKDPYFAVGYCRSRRERHKNILLFQHKFSSIIKEFMDCIRQAVKTSAKSRRMSSGSDWEHSGLSYVMTVSYLICKKNYLKWDDFNPLQKRNIYALLNPGLINEDDSLLIDEKKEPCDPAILFDFPVETCPTNYESDLRQLAFFSWAAVLVFRHDSDIDNQEVYHALEVNLQAKWMLIYCLSYNMNGIEEKNKSKKILKKYKISDLKKMIIETDKIEHNLLNIRDPSIPSRVKEIRDGLITTSGIIELMSEYRKQLNYSMVAKETEILDHQRKYNITSQIFLFTIAFIQIAPVCYQFFSGKIDHLNISAAVATFSLFILGLFVLYKSES